MAALRDAQGAIAGFFAVGKDITWRRQVDAALRESEERFRQAFDAAPIGIAVAALDGHWLQVNPGLLEPLHLESDGATVDGPIHRFRQYRDRARSRSSRLRREI